MRMSDDDWDTVIDTNLAGAFRCARRASKGMIRLRRGRIVLISSVVGLYGGPGQANYAASKAGLVGLARSITRELGGRGITANVVAPGFIETDMTAALPEDTQKSYKAAIPAGRFATARRGGRRGPLPRLRRGGLHLRRRHPRRRRPRHGSLTRPRAPRVQHVRTAPHRPPSERSAHVARGQEAARHRRPHGLLDRLPRRPARAGAGRRGRAHLVRPHDEDHLRHRQAAAADPAGGRARRHQRRRPRRAGRPGPRARAAPRRRRALDRLRPAGRLQLHGGRAGTTSPPPCTSRPTRSPR